MPRERDCQGRPTSPMPAPWGLSSARPRPGSRGRRCNGRREDEAGVSRYLVRLPLELPRREAPDVDVELVQSGIVAVTRELNLEFHLIAGHGVPAHRTESTDAGPAPCAVWPTLRKLAITDDSADLLAEDRLVGYRVGHLIDFPTGRTREALGGPVIGFASMPDARGRDARVRQPRNPMEGTFTIAQVKLDTNCRVG